MTTFELVFPTPTFHNDTDKFNLDYWFTDVLEVESWRQYGSNTHVEFAKQPTDGQKAELEALFKRYGITEYEWLQPEEEEDDDA
jgi:hypothetical protein